MEPKQAEKTIDIDVEKVATGKEVPNMDSKIG